MPLENSSTSPNNSNLIDEGDIYAGSDVFLVAVYITIGLLVVIGNSVVVVVVVASRELHRPTLWNIAFMGVTDLTYGLYYFIFVIPSRLMNQFAYSESLRFPAYLALTFLFGQNVLNVLVAIVDRFFVVCWPLHYPRLMSASRFTIAIASTTAINVGRILLLVFTHNVVYYNGHSGMCLIYFNNKIAGFASVGLPGVTTMCIVMLLLKINFELKKSAQIVRSTASSRSSIQFTIAISLSAAVFILCYMPTIATIIWNVLFGTKSIAIWVAKLDFVLMLSNSFLNVIIYATTYRPFRNAFLKLICCTRDNQNKT